MAAVISPTAFVAPTAQLADGVIIGHCAVVEDNVIIGEGTRVDAFASIKAYTRMGKNNHVHSYAMVGGVPQDLKFHGEESWLEIGDSNTIREFSTQHRGTESGGAVTRIGNNNLLMAYTHVAHDCQLGSRIIMSNNATLAGHVTVHDGAIIGGLAAVHQFARIGKNAFLGGMSGAGQDVPPYMLASGPRAELHGPNMVGLRRVKASREEISAIRAVYRLIWLSAIPRKEALEQAEYEYGTFDQVRDIVDFVRQSQRGVTPAASKESAAEGTE